MPGAATITTHLADLDAGEFPEVRADAAWYRWVLTFTTRPRDVLARVAQSLRPGGTIVLHEYFVNGPRLVELGYLSTADSAAVNDATRSALMIRPE